MQVFDAVRTVLAVREYQAKPVPAEVIRRIVEAGRLTGSSQNGQPWHFVVVENRESLRRLGELAPTGRYVAQAAAAIVVAIEPTSSATSDASRAIQSMILTAWSEGVGSNWVGLRNSPEIKAFLAIPGNLQALAMVPLGYPVNAHVRGIKKRKPLSAVAFRERFGQTFE